MNRTPLALIILRAVFVMVLVGIAALIINSEFVKASPHGCRGRCLAVGWRCRSS